MEIKQVSALEILDSRGNPTLKAITQLSDGSIGAASVPSGASTGIHEAVELRDGDKGRYAGLGVQKAVSHVAEISHLLSGTDAARQQEIDQKMIDLDGTPNKSRLGANAILAVSLSVAKAQATAQKVPLYKYLSGFDPDFSGQYLLPVPQLNVINGGKHANWSTDIQEFMLLPVSSSTFSDTLRMGTEIYHQLYSLLKSRGLSVTVGDEGGFAPNFSSNKEPFEFLHEAIDKAGYTQSIRLGIDAASSEFYKEGSYHLKKEGSVLTSRDLSDFWLSLKKDFPISTMEDVFDQDDWEGFSSFTRTAGSRMQIVGDDLYVTNIQRLQMGIDRKATNSILIKLNQIGTLTETISAILLARKNGLTSVVSHRSGETEDTFIADLVVGLGTGQIKSGAPCRTERTAKYNRLLEIEHELGDQCRMAEFPENFL